MQTSTSFPICMKSAIKTMGVKTDCKMSQIGGFLIHRMEASLWTKRHLRTLRSQLIEAPAPTVLTYLWATRLVRQIMYVKLVVSPLHRPRCPLGDQPNT